MFRFDERRNISLALLTLRSDTNDERMRRLLHLPRMSQSQNRDTVIYMYIIEVMEFGVIPLETLHVWISR